ncbi:hypothetical protein HK098_005440 [Nowakowskiella sp. JEL0407]|nr:hypothetical protein HK098_005440 [Nowakowskiella sp. JEL0407]
MKKDKSEHEIPSYPDPPGPKSKRRLCRDLPWLIIFVCFWAGMVVISIFALKYGNINRLKYARDSEGNLCGSPIAPPKVNNIVNALNSTDVNDGVSKYFNGTQDLTTVCVESCPTVSFDPSTTICEYDVNKTEIDLARTLNPSKWMDAIANGRCALTLESSPVLGRCLPKFLVDGASSLSNSTQNNANSTISIPISPTKTNNASLNLDYNTWGQNFVSNLNTATTPAKIFQDVIQSWPIILASCGIALLISFIWLILLQYFAGFFVWITLTLALSSSWILGAAFLYSWYIIASSAPNSSVQNVSWIPRSSAPIIQINSLHGSNESKVIDQVLYNELLLLILGIILLSIAFLLSLCTCCCLRRIKIAIKLIKETAKATASMPSILLVPLFKYIFLMVLMLWTVFIYVLLASSGTPITKATNTFVSDLSRNVSTYSAGKILEFQPSLSLPYLQIYFIFGYFWTHHFLIAVSQTTLAGAISSWYWTQTNKSIITKSFPVLKSFIRVLLCHLGSLAFGSLIIALVDFIRWVITKLEKQAEKKSGAYGKGGCLGGFVRFLIKIPFWVVKCFCGCFFNIIKFMNRNAYIEIAVYGYGFCKASRKAFWLICRNALRFAVLDKVSDFILFLGKLFIVFSTTIAGLFLLMYYRGSEMAWTNFAVPSLIIMLFSYSIASSVLAVLEIAIDTVFFCVCEDLERNNGTPEKPYYMSDSLRETIGKYQKPPNVEKK